jgi:hypothetical protein
VNKKWFKDCKDQEQVEDRRKMIQNGAPLLNVLKKLVETELNDVINNSEKRDGYDSPSWAYRQADNIGAIRTLKSMLSLLDQEEK